MMYSHFFHFSEINILAENFYDFHSRVHYGRILVQILNFISYEYELTLDSSHSFEACLEGHTENIQNLFL